MHIFACDATEHGLLLLCGESVRSRSNGTDDKGGREDKKEDEKERPSSFGGELEGLVVPPLTPGWNSARMEVRSCYAQVKIAGPTTCYMEGIEGGREGGREEGLYVCMCVSSTFS